MVLEAPAGGIPVRSGYVLHLRRVVDAWVLTCEQGGGGCACSPRGDGVRKASPLEGSAGGESAGSSTKTADRGAVIVCVRHERPLSTAWAAGKWAARAGAREGWENPSAGGDGVERAFRGGLTWSPRWAARSKRVWGPGRNAPERDKVGEGSGTGEGGSVTQQS